MLNTCLKYLLVCLLFCGCPVNSDVCPRRLLKNSAVSCNGLDYSSVACESYLTEKGYEKLSDVKFPEIETDAVVDSLTNIQSLSEIAGTFMCCSISKVSPWNYGKLSFVYEEFCDVNFHLFSHHKAVAKLAEENLVNVKHFNALASFCPARITQQHANVARPAPWKKIRPAVNRNSEVKNNVVVDGVCNKFEVESNNQETGEFTILLADEDIYYGSLKSFVGSIEDLTEDKFMIWGANENLYSLEIVRNIHGVAIDLHDMKVSRAIQFRGVNIESIKQAWKQWTEDERYSLLNRSCVHSAIHLLQAGLGNVCDWNQNVEFPFPLSTFEQMIEIGQSTTVGKELNEEKVNEIQNKIKEILLKKEKENQKNDNQ